MVLASAVALEGQCASSCDDCSCCARTEAQQALNCPSKNRGKAMRYSVSSKIPIPSLLPLAVILLGCGPTVELVLSPAEVAQDCTSAHHFPGEAWCDVQKGLACRTGAESVAGAAVDVVTADELKMFTDKAIAPASGWSDDYDPGSQPMACPWWISNFSLAYVKFDIKQGADTAAIKGGGKTQDVASAFLAWETKRIKGNQEEACIKNLHIATGPWVINQTPTALVVDNLDLKAPKIGFVGVTPQAKNWLANPAQNFGFVIEPSRASTASYSDAKCMEALQNLRLIIRYRIQTIKWPGT
jgi:hypothetical protein